MKIQRTFKMNMIMKTILFAIALAFFGQTSFAQNATMSETINDDTTSFKKNVVQVPLEQCSRIDTCEEKRYAIVLKDAKCGIYDLQRHENVTDIKYDDLAFSRRQVAEDGTEIFYFYAEKGIEQGLIGVYGENNQTLGMWQDNPEYVGALDECTTIDSEITKKCYNLLGKGLKELNGVDGQIAVIDAKSCRLKAWVALEKKDNGFAETKLLKKAYSPRSMMLMGVTPILADIGASLEDSVDICGGVYDAEDGLKIKDHNWSTGGYGTITIREALVRKSNVAMYKILQVGMGKDEATRLWLKMTRNNEATNAMEIAAMLASSYKGNSFIIPTLKGDSVDVETDNKIKPLGHLYMHEILLGLNQADGIQANYAPENIELAGIYGNGSLEENEGKVDLAETSFAGLFPAEKPRYCVCVFIHRPNEPERSSKDLALSVVNELIAWLMKY